VVLAVAHPCTKAAPKPPDARLPRLRSLMPCICTFRVESKIPAFRSTGRSTGAFDYNAEEEWFEAGI